MATLHFAQALLPDGWARDVRIAIDGDHIAAIIKDASAQAGDERHAIGIPGVASLHSHAFQRAMAGFGEVRSPTADTFWTWRDMMYRFALSITPDEVEAVARQLYCELVESGFTRVGEFHYLHHDRDGQPYTDLAEMGARIAAAASSSGIGLTLIPCFYAHGGFGGAATHEGQRRFLNSLDRYARLVEATAAAIKPVRGANIALAPHSLRAATFDEISRLVQLAAGRPIHIHVAEQVKEVEDCVAWSGKRPVEWLLANAPVNDRWCLIHATHVTDAESRGLANSGAVVGLCPITEASLGDGIFPAAAFCADGGRFGVGSDSNSRIDLAEELRILEFGQRLNKRERNVLAGGPSQSTGRALFEAALHGGAQALGQRWSGIVAGACADLVSLDAHHPALVAKAQDQILDGWIFAGGRDVVDCVWAGGVKQVEGGRHRLRDEARRAFNAAVARLAA